MHLKYDKLRIPTGGRLTSWLFTRRGGVEFEDKSIQWQGEGFEPGTSGLQVQRPTTRPRSPPSEWFFLKIFLNIILKIFLKIIWVGFKDATRKWLEWWKMKLKGESSRNSSDWERNYIASKFNGRSRRSDSGFFLNPLNSVPPVTARDGPWPFFHFWRHHFWPKLASSILNFCWRKRSFQWCPDQSDRPDGAWDMHKNA